MHDDHLDISEEIDAGCRVIAITVLSAVAMVSVGLWAISKPDRPAACRSFPTECAAAVIEVRP